MTRPSRLQRGDDFDLALLVQHAAFADRAADERNVVDRSRRKGQSAGRRDQTGCIADGGALDRRLRPVEKRIEHLRIEPADARLFRRQSVMAPYGFGRRLREMRQPFVAASGRDDAESGGPRPIDEIADQRRLVAIREAVDHARVGRLARQQRTAKGIGLHGDVDHVLAVAERGKTMLDRRRRVAGAFDHDVDVRMRDQLLPVVADMRGALGQRVVERSGGGSLRRPAHARQVGPRIGGREIGDAGQMHAGDLRHLGQVHRAELAGADQARRAAGCAAPRAAQAWSTGSCCEAVRRHAVSHAEDTAFRRGACTRRCACRSRSCRRWSRTAAPALRSRSRAWRASSPCPTCRP